MRVAITRGVSPTIGNCELTFLEREEIDVDTARAQHSLYEGLLEGLGCRVEHLAGDPGFPDSVFVEDIAVVLDEIAISRGRGPCRDVANGCRSSERSPRIV